MSSILITLAKGLEGKVFEPDSDVYDASLKSYFTLQESQLKPSFIITPTSAQDVAQVLKFLRAKNPDTKIATEVAIRKSGHNPFTVGGGAIWGQIYDKLDTIGLSVVGGHVYDVGVGGFTLGGGFSSSSPRYGICCNIVDNFEVVLVDGQIINTNVNANSDLWIAFKGGSNNFGVVIWFDIKTFPQGKQWAGLVLYPISTLNKNFKALENMHNDWDPYASMKPSITF